MFDTDTNQPNQNPLAPTPVEPAVNQAKTDQPTTPVNKFKPTKNWLTVLVVLLIAITIPVAVYVAQQRQEIRPKAQSVPAGFDLFVSGPCIYAINTSNTNNINVTYNCSICSGTLGDGCSNFHGDYLRSCGGGSVTVPNNGQQQQIICEPTTLNPCENFQVDAHTPNYTPAESDAITGEHPDQTCATPPPLSPCGLLDDSRYSFEASNNFYLWSPGGSATMTVARSSNTASHGSYSLRADYHGAADTSFYWLGTNVSQVPDTNERFRLIGYYNLESRSNSNGTIRLCLSVKNASDVEIASDCSDVINLSSPTLNTWNSFTGDVLIPYTAGANHVEPWVRISGVNDVVFYVDAFCLTEESIPNPSPSPVLPTATFSNVCSLNQKIGYLSYDLKLSNLTGPGAYNSAAFFLSFPTSKQRSDIRTYLGTPSWDMTGWYGYLLYQCVTPDCQPTNSEIPFVWNRSTLIGSNQRTIDQLATWAATNLPSDYKFLIGSNLRIGGVQNDDAGHSEVYILPNACAPTADFSAVCTPDQQYGALSYTLTLNNIQPGLDQSGTFNSAAFFLSFPTSKQRSDIRTYLGTPSWDMTGWYGYSIYWTDQLGANNRVAFAWNTASGVKLGSNQRSIDDLSNWVQQGINAGTFPSTYQFTIGSNVRLGNIQNDDAGNTNVAIKPDACAQPQPSPNPFCADIRFYTVAGNVWTSTDPNRAQPGQQIYITVLAGVGTVPTTYTAGRLRINSGSWQVTTNLKPKSSIGEPDEFYITYTIPADGTRTFNVGAEVQSGGLWY